jgi:hypothetical protein
MIHNHKNILIKLSKGEAGEAWAPFNKTVLMCGERFFFGGGGSEWIVLFIESVAL